MKTTDILLILFISFFLFISCDQQSMPDSNKIRVATSITPLADFVKQVGGEHVEVFTIVPPNTDPHTFELTPELMVKISNSQLLVINGVGFEFWADKVSDNIKKEKFIIVDTSSGIKIIQELHHDHDHAHESGNPHIWLNPLNAIRQVLNIRDALIELDSENRSEYESNAESYIGQLKSLDQEFQDEINTWKRKKFICFHPAWEYFAIRYGLDQAAAVEKSPGAQPGPKEIIEIIKKIESLNVKAIFTEAQFPDNLSKSIAQESGIKVIPLDPIGVTNNTDHYIEMMKYNVKQMALGLKE